MTTAAVEEFVERHYGDQIKRLGTDPIHDGDPASQELRRLLLHCCEDEVHHKEEAAERAGNISQADSLWQWFVGKGSAAAALAAKRI